jgi:hypothetical protein
MTEEPSSADRARARVLAELDEIGEDEARYKLAQSHYGGPENQDRRPVVEEWLRRIDRRRGERDGRRTRRIAVSSIVVSGLIGAVTVTFSALSLIVALSRRTCP